MLARVSLRIGLPPVTDVCPYDAYPSVVLALAAPQIRSLDPEEVLQARKRG
jgi:hypothetical protein